VTATAPGRIAQGLVALLLLLPAALILGLAFVAPLARLAALSVSAPEGPLAAFSELLGEEVYRRIFLNTIVLALVVTAATLAIGFPVALALTRLEIGWRTILFACVLVPLWISVLVRTFSWMLLLERNGPINRVLMGAGLTEQPLPLLFNTAGVTIGMTHVLLPYAVLPIYAALARIDPALMRASEGLGASRLTTFRRVLLPLSARGVATAATFTFLLSLGFFITPAVLGGPASTTIPILIDSFVNERLNWPLAASASIVLLAMALGIVALASRVVPVGALAEAR